MQKPTTIWRDSPAWNRLELALADPDTYKVSVAIDEPDDDGHVTVMVKINEGMWTLPLRSQLREESPA